MAFSEYIKNQLLFNGRITLPGLGSLDLVKEPAKIKGKKIVPPGTGIIFNPDITLDDGKLSQSLASAEETDLEEARQKVLEFVDEVVFKLNKGEAFNFEGLGSLYRDEDNVIRFEKDPSFVVDYDSFGLESFELEPFEEEQKLLNESGEKESALINKPDQKEAPIQPPPVVLQKEVDNNDLPVKNNRNIFWYIMGAMVVIAGGFIVLRMTTDILDNPSLDALNFWTKDTVTLHFEDEKQTQPGDLEVLLDSMSKTENALLPDEDTPITLSAPSLNLKEYKEYHIIAGSFKDTVNAQELARELTMKGYPALIIKQGNNLYRVSALSFRDKEAGLKELQRFRGQTKNNAAWLLGLNMED